MAVPTVVGSAGSSAASTTSATATIPTYAANDIIYVTGVNGGATANLSCADNAAQGAYTIRAQLTIGTGRSNTWWRRATGTGTGHVVTVSGATNSTACSVQVFRGCKTSGDPFFIADTGVAVTSARSAIAAGVTPTLADGVDYLLVGAVNSTDNIDTTAFSTVNTGAFTQRGGGSSSGGNDTQSECWTDTLTFPSATGDVSFTNAAAAGINHGVHLTGLAGGAFEQTAFRGRDDSQTLNSTTFTSALNTNWSQAVDTVFRVRLEFEEDGPNGSLLVGVGATGVTGKGVLEYSHNGGAWALVNTTTSDTTPVQSTVSTQYATGDATTDVLSGSGASFQAGAGVENTTWDVGAMVGVHTEVEYALTIDSGQVTNGDTIALRIAGCVGRTTQLPTITVQEGAVEVIPEINMAPMR